MGFLRFLSRKGSKKSATSSAAVYQTKAARIADIEATIIAHRNWRINFNAYLSGQVKNLSQDHISCDNRCILGKWLHTVGQERYGQYAIFVEILEEHKKFHDETAKAFKFYQENQHDLAKNHLETVCASISAKLQTRLNDLKSMA